MVNMPNFLRFHLLLNTSTIFVWKYETLIYFLARAIFQPGRLWFSYYWVWPLRHWYRFRAQPVNLSLIILVWLCHCKSPELLCDLIIRDTYKVHIAKWLGQFYSKINKHFYYLGKQCEFLYLQDGCQMNNVPICICLDNIHLLSYNMFTHT